MWPFTRKKQVRRKRRRTRDIWKPTAKVLSWSKKDALSLETAYGNIFICGAPGSSKTTSSGAALAERLLDLKCGFLVLVAKSDEIPRWLKYCRRTGRSRDVRVFGPGEAFDFIDYENTRDGGGGHIENLVNLMSIACEIASRSQAQRSGGQEEARFWQLSRDELCRNAAVLLQLGLGSVGVRAIYDLVMSAPLSPHERDSAEWRANSFCAHCLTEAERNCSPQDEDQLHIAANYFLHVWPTHDERTRSNISSTFTSMIDVLLRGLPKQMLCGNKTTVTPEWVEDGGVLVMGVSLLEHALPAALIQGLVKYSFQRALLRRNIAMSPRPVVIFADEFQLFLNSFDQEFFAISRSARVINIGLTQNLPNLFTALGGEQRGKSQVDSLLGNMNLKICHANSDPTTNDWTSNSIGASKTYRFNASTSHQGGDWWSSGLGYGGMPHVSSGITENYEMDVNAADLLQLRTGGRRNGWQADAIVFQNGQVFSDTGKTWRRATFRQRF